MTKKRLDWNESLWTIVEETDGGVLLIPDTKNELLDFIDYANGLVDGVVLYENFGISYTAESWGEFLEELEWEALTKQSFYFEIID